MSRVEQAATRRAIDRRIRTIRQKLEEIVDMDPDISVGLLLYDPNQSSSCGKSANRNANGQTHVISHLATPDFKQLFTHPYTQQILRASIVRDDDDDDRPVESRTLGTLKSAAPH